jgi:hypothetical protein
MIVPITRQTNIKPDLPDQTNVTLNISDTILKTATTRTELERSWATIEPDISIEEYLEARQRQLKNQP